MSSAADLASIRIALAEDRIGQSTEAKGVAMFRGL